MRFPCLSGRSWLFAALVALGIAAAPSVGWAVGEEITDVRILGNTRTDEATVRSIAGVSIGDTLDMDTLDMVRERLNTTGLFADVNVWWEPHGAGVRVNISVKDKFPWAPVPTGSLAANNKSLGLVFVHGNLFGRGKQMLIGARIATIDSGAALAYRDPSFFGTWIYWQIQGLVQRQVIPEFDNANLADPVEVRETRLLSYGFEPTIGIAWFRRVRTQVGWHLEKFRLDKSDDPMNTDMQLQDSTKGGLVGYGKASLTFDFRAREFAVMTGPSLSAGIDYGGPGAHGDFTFWRAGAGWEHGIRFFRSHNFIYGFGANVAHNAPLFAENYAGGPSLRGYLYQQFRGDTQLGGKAEYHFPLFSISSLDFRALLFYDFSAIWFRELPDPATSTITGTDGRTYLLRDTIDQRTFPITTPRGFNFDDSIHNSVGVGLRFFLRSVAVPLIGVDAGYGVEARNWRFILVVGA